MRKVMPTQPSWSEICRNSVNILIEEINNAEFVGCIPWAMRVLSNSYRPDIYKIRCAKLLTRAIKKGKVKENSKAKNCYFRNLNKYST